MTIRVVIIRWLLATASIAVVGGVGFTLPEPECPPPACGQWSERYVESPACSWKIMSMEVAICSWRMCSVRGGGRAGGQSWWGFGFVPILGVGTGDAVALPKWRCSASAAKDRSGGARSSFSPSPAVEILPLENAMHDLLLSCSWRRSAMHTSLRIEMVAFIASRPCTFFFIMETKFQCTIPTQPHLCNNRLEIWVWSKLAKKVYIYTTCVFSGFRWTLIKWVVPCRTVCLS
jgi:hypothetical protein